MDPLTIHHLLRQATNVRIFEYDCYMHPDHAPLQLSVLKDALQHIRTTLTDLTVRYEHYNNNRYLNVVACETEDAVTCSLGPLHHFPVLAALTISLPVLFGIDTAALDDTPSLAEYLPATLETLTIRTISGSTKSFKGDTKMSTPSSQPKRSEPYTLETTRGKVDLDKIESEILWVQDRELEWKAATPLLKKLTYGLTKLCLRYWYLSKPKAQLLGLCESQGIKGEVLLWSANPYHNLISLGWIPVSS